MMMMMRKRRCTAEVAAAFRSGAGIRRRIAFLVKSSADNSIGSVGRTTAEKTLCFDRNGTVESLKRISGTAI